MTSGRTIITNEFKKINDFKNKYKSYFYSEEYLEHDEIKKSLRVLFPKELSFKFRFVFCISFYFQYLNFYNQIENLYLNLEEKIDKHNDILLEDDKKLFKECCGLVEGKKLDEQQLDSVVRRNKNQLVIASAGSGKTTTIIGKVKYLLQTNRVKPENLLLLSFTNASALEMKERVYKETGFNLDVYTFHKLGLEILKESSNNSLKILNKDITELIRNYLNDLKKDNDYMRKLMYFMATARFDLKDEFSFKNEKEYKDYLKTNPPTTLKGEIVKSYGELEIANFLYANNINYVYEKEYEFTTKDKNYEQYRPDFYLPDYKIYIEYFGIDKNNNVPTFYKSNNEMSAKEVYLNSMKWKRNLHKNNNTTLIETYYYENHEHKLIYNLREKLKSNNVKIMPMPKEQLWEEINKRNSGIFSEICNVFNTIINLIKSNNYNLDDLYELDAIKKVYLNKFLLDLVKPVYDLYQDYLKSNNMIDFNDMINLASNTINENKFIHNYDYVIVDEYQDMSKARYNLLLSMRNQHDYKLYSVGDDWQSIYQFNGSDIDLITNYEKYWGKTYLSYIETTYRFTSNISKISGRFIMKNPHQYKKNINAKADDNYSINFINAYTEQKSIDFLVDNLKRLEKNSSVFLLGRYSFDIEKLKENNNFQFKYSIADNLTKITLKNREDLDIKFLTIHKSKGLQADYVFILNNKKYRLGFPSKISNLPIIDLLLSSKGNDYPFSEERRLMYVALTRCKKNAYLLTIDNNKSTFIEELKDIIDLSQPVIKNTHEKIQSDKIKKINDYNEIKTPYVRISSHYRCPKCGHRLYKRKSKYGYFLGCSNYPKCKYIRNIKRV